MFEIESEASYKGIENMTNSELELFFETIPPEGSEADEDCSLNNEGINTP